MLDVGVWPNIFLPTIDISSMMMYCTSFRDCCILWSDSPSRSLNSPFVGNCSNECRVHPWTLKAATPVGAVTTTLWDRSCFKHAMRKDLPVPAVPVMITLSGSVTPCEKCWSTVWYAFNCVPCSSCGSALVGSVIVIIDSINVGASERLGYALAAFHFPL